MRNLAAVLFIGGLGFFLFVLFFRLPLGAPPLVAGAAILEEGGETVGAANLVTAVLLAYRGMDTLGELSILFAAATAVGLVLGRRQLVVSDPEGGFILRAGSDLLFPLLLVVGLYVILHGHLTPGGGFQGGVILAAAFFVPVLARPRRGLDHGLLSFVEGLAGAAFIGIGLWALFARDAFLEPLLGKGVLGHLFSAGTLPLLSMAVGLKVGAELAGLMTSLMEAEGRES